MYLICRRAMLLALSILLFAIPVQAGDTAKALFIQTAEKMTFDGNTLTLLEVSPKVVWFTDRPEQKTGQITIKEFLAVWAKGADSFSADPPNVVLIVKGAKTGPAVVEISAPLLRGNDLSYKIEIIEGDVPVSGKATTLVIDGKVIGIDLGTTNSL